MAIKNFEEVRDILEKEVSEKDYVYVGSGIEFRLGTTWSRIQLAIFALKEEGYRIHYIRVGQAVVRILTKDYITYETVWANRDKIN